MALLWTIAMIGGELQKLKLEQMFVLLEKKKHFRLDVSPSPKKSRKMPYANVLKDLKNCRSKNLESS